MGGSIHSKCYNNFNWCHSRCPLFRGCPLVGGSIIEGSTVIPIGAVASVLYIEVVLWWEGPFNIRGSTVPGICQAS